MNKTTSTLSRKPKPSPVRGARSGNANAAKPARERRVMLRATRVDPATLALVQRHAADFGGEGRVLDAALKLLAQSGS